RRRRLELARRARRARPLPLLQGLHTRVPGQRRPADAEGGVPVTPLRAAAAAAARVRVRADRPVGQARLRLSWRSKCVHSDTGTCFPSESGGRNSSTAALARFRTSDVPGVVRGARTTPREQARALLAGYVLEPLRARGRD